MTMRTLAAFVLLGVTTAGLSACSEGSDTSDQSSFGVCTNDAGLRVDDALCDRPDNRNSVTGSPFLWMWLASGSHMPGVGQRVAGGTRLAPAGVPRYVGVPKSGGPVAPKTLRPPKYPSSIRTARSPMSPNIYSPRSPASTPKSYRYSGSGYGGSKSTTRR